MSRTSAAAAPGLPEHTIPPATAPRAQAIATAAAQVLILAVFLPAAVARCLGLF